MENCRTFKLVTIGDAGVGKSHLINRYADGIFGPIPPNNLGIEFRIHRIKVDGEPIKLQIWDTSGMERYRMVSLTYYRGAHGLFLVYDVTNMKSFTNIKTWLAQVEDSVSDDSVFKLLVGNKVDLESKRVVPYSQAKEFADEIGIPVIETSAKTSFNVEQMFVLTAAGILNRLKENQENSDYNSHESNLSPREGCLGGQTRQQHPGPRYVLNHFLLTDCRALIPRKKRQNDNVGPNYPIDKDGSKTPYVILVGVVPVTYICSSCSQMENCRTFKLVTIGDAGVGKSHLIHRYADGIFGPIPPNNLGSEFSIHRIKVDGEPIKLQIWNTSGMERFLAVSRTYYRGAHGLFLVYDVTNMKSFTNIKTWMAQVEDSVSDDSVFKLLVGNKVDLESKRVVPYSQAKEFADKMGIPVIETSAKTSFNVEQMFVLTAAGILNRLKENQANTDFNSQESNWSPREGCVSS